MKTKQYNLRMATDVIEWVNQQAAKDDRTPGIWLSRFIKDYMEKSAPKKISTIKTEPITFNTWPYTPNEDLLNAWLKSKKAAKGSTSQQAINTVGKELHKAQQQGFTVEECLEKAENSKWKGFDASWMRKDNEASQRSDRDEVARQLSDPNRALANW